MGEIGAWQWRHLPPSASQLMTGTLSYGLMRVAQCGQRERGDTMDVPSGIRVMQTLRKLPTMSPKSKNAAMVTFRL